VAEFRRLSGSSQDFSKVFWLTCGLSGFRLARKGAEIQFSFPRDRWFESTSLQRRVGCELDSWIMVGADGLGSKEDVRVFNLIVLAQFVWRVSSAAIPARRPQVVAPPDRMPRPYRVRRTRRDVRQRVSAPMGPMVYCRRNTAGARSPRSGAPLFPRNPKAGPSFPCAWAFGDRRWRGRRQVAIGPPGLFGLVRRDDLGA
jgi:hypothetical protein